MIYEFHIFESFAKNFKGKGAHLVYDTGINLPYAKIDLLQKSNGIMITTGDKTHPTAIEVQYCYPDWAERLELQLQQWIDIMQQLNTPRLLKPSAEGMVS